MTSPVTPIAGYREQPQKNLDLVNANKRMEERMLRHLDGITRGQYGPVDPRWLAVGRTHLEQAWMAINRSIMQPSRIGLPEDDQAVEPSRPV